MSPSQGDKTEKATSKKRQDARKKGQLLKSTEVNTAFLMLVTFAVLSLFSGTFVSESVYLLKYFLSNDLSTVITFDSAGLLNLLLMIIQSLIAILLPICGIMMIAGVLINIVQTGFFFSGKQMAPKFSRINPKSGIKRMFSMRGIMEMFKSILKLVIIGYIVYIEYESRVEAIPQMMLLSVPDFAAVLFDAIVAIGFNIGAAMVVLAIIDYIYQWRRHEKDLMMTKQEVKDEFKQAEGDPQVKGMIRQKQRQLGMMRMMQSIPEADVVITNPTHYAVALQYNDDKQDAPIVLAKGKDLIAQHIKELAREHGVDIVENKPVARALYVYCEVGDPIPQDMYKAVAEILAYVYRLHNKAAGGAR